MRVLLALALLLLSAGTLRAQFSPTSYALAWFQQPESQHGTPDTYLYQFTLTTANPANTNECMAVWTVGPNGETLRNGVHVGNGGTNATVPPYRCVNGFTIYVDSNGGWWRWNPPTQAWIAEDIPPNSSEYPVPVVLNSVTCVDELNNNGWTCRAPFAQVYALITVQPVDIQVRGNKGIVFSSWSFPFTFDQSNIPSSMVPPNGLHLQPIGAAPGMSTGPAPVPTPGRTMTPTAPTAPTPRTMKPRK